MIKTIILLICSVASISCAQCPDPNTILPCVCSSHESTITCNGEKDFNLKHVFDKISAHSHKYNKHFKTFLLTNPEITSIEDHAFSDVSFEKISITGTNRLRKISRHALNASALTLNEFELRNGNQITDEYINEFFDALSSLVVVNRIFLDLIKVTKIPDNAFKIINGRQTNLESIHFNNIGARYGSLTSVGNHAFYYLDNLKHLSISNQPITQLKAHAFDFEKSSVVDLIIHIQATHVSAQSFEVGIFMDSKRPLTLQLSNNRINYFEEKVWKPVLESTDESKMVSIILTNNLLTCDCKMHWMVRDKAQLLFNLLDPECLHYGSLWDMTENDFIKC